MQGNFDQPPIVIYTSALKSLSLMTACGLAAAFCWFDLSLGSSYTTRAASGLVAFGLGVPYYGWLFLSPNTLIVSPEGVALKTRWRNLRWSWNEVSRFRALGVHIATWHIGFDLREPPAGPRTFAQYCVSYAGADDSLGSGWEMSAGRLADLLNLARARWLTRPVAQQSARQNDQAREVFRTSEA
jgi:hypothetical protein